MFGDMDASADAMLRRVQGCVNEELARQYGQLGHSLRDFLYDLLNYPLERPWRESLAIFAEHWTDRGLKLTPRTLDAIGQLITEELGDEVDAVDADSKAVALAEAPAAAPGGSSTATDAILPMAPLADRRGTSTSAAADKGLAGYLFAASERGRKEQLRLNLTDDERRELEAYIVQSLRAQARGEPPILPPLSWYNKHKAWLEIHARQPEMRAATKEQ